jgi:hypothetical protein
MPGGLSKKPGRRIRAPGRAREIIVRPPRPGRWRRPGPAAVFQVCSSNSLESKILVLFIDILLSQCRLAVANTSPLAHHDH